MGEPLSAPAQNVDSFAQARPSGGIGVLDEGSADDGEPPSIPSDSSASVKETFSVEDGPSAETVHDPTLAHDAAHTLSVARVARLLTTDASNGLSTELAKTRLAENGPNRLETSGGVGPWRILLRQISNSLTLVLVIAMALSYGTFDFIEGGVITAVILLNIVIGFFQDYRAEQTIQSLRAMAAPVCKVVRDNGTVSTLKAEDLVVGDVVQLAVGDIVAADLRLAHTINLATDEALLTGEAKPCPKDADRILAEANVPVGDRINIVYSSTTVTRGRGSGVVIATGMDTEIGKIAQLLQDKKKRPEGPFIVRFSQRFVDGLKNALGLVGTPLQVKLSWFALLLFSLAILLAVIVFSANKWDIDDETLIYGICVAVAVIPESLIAVLTITMAVGSKAMAKGNVIIRKLGALEAIGGVTNICSDKTGTLTQGKMLARKAFLPSGKCITVENTTSPFDPTSGVVRLAGRDLVAADVPSSLEMSRFFQTIALCNMSSLVKGEHDTEPAAEKNASTWNAIGEPTEIALQVLASRVGHGKPQLVKNDNFTLLTEHSFDSAIKRMTVVFTDNREGVNMVYVKGATEALLPLMNVSPAQKSVISEWVDSMASEGLRVLCLGYKQLDAEKNHDIQNREAMESDLTFAGLVGLYDPPRRESAGAIAQCQRAGITVHMLTGDHLKTATTIAREIGIIGNHVSGSESTFAIMTAMTFDKMADSELDELDTLPLVLARCSPATKLRMLHALHRRGKYCVMTGDGVNDSPALKGADVGVAMGLNGSDVSKDAADMVLTDDNFASIVSAIREGRRLFDNIQKFLLHLLISNISQVILLLIGLAFKDKEGNSAFPLSPLEILWANLITSSFLAIGLGLEECSPDVMTRPPHSLKIGVFTKGLIIDKFIYGTFLGTLCLVSFVVVAYGPGGGQFGHGCNDAYNDSCDVVFRARGTAYSILTILLCVTAWEVKHFERSLFNMYPEMYSGPFSVIHTIRKNRFLFFAVMAGMLTPFPIIYIPVINTTVFRHKGLTWEWGLVFGSLVCYIALVEAWKAIKRRFYKPNYDTKELA